MRIHTQHDMQIGMYTHAKYHENKHANTYYIHDNTQSTGLHTCIHAFLHKYEHTPIHSSDKGLRSVGDSFRVRPTTHRVCACIFVLLLPHLRVHANVFMLVFLFAVGHAYVLSFCYAIIVVPTCIWIDLYCQHPCAGSPAWWNSGSVAVDARAS